MVDGTEQLESGGGLPGCRRAEVEVFTDADEASFGSPGSRWIHVYFTSLARYPEILATAHLAARYRGV